MYRIRILDEASRELAQLDKPVANRLVKRVRWLAANLENLTPEALSGDLAGFFKLRVGDYRVLYQILPDEKVIVLHAIGHRKDIYRNR